MVEKGNGGDRCGTGHRLELKSWRLTLSAARQGRRQDGKEHRSQNFLALVPNDSLEAEKLTSLLAQRGIFIVLQVCRLYYLLEVEKTKLTTATTQQIYLLVKETICHC